MTEKKQNGKPLDRKTLDMWREHWRDESDAAFLYGRLAEAEPEGEKSAVYRGLAEVEERHVGMWQKLFDEHGLEPPARNPSMRARFLAWFGLKFGPQRLLALLLREEGHEVRGYFSLYQDSESGSTADTALCLATESAQHARTLGRLAGTHQEPWHRIESGGYLRNVVYGFNDGLTANFGLVAGVVGAHVEPGFILFTGIAGTIADALSMGSSGYLAAKSEEEVFEHEISMEKEEIRLMPEIEEEELTYIYRARGVHKDLAREIARDIVASPEQTLREMVREELKIGDRQITPLREGWITGLATAIGAFIPVAPFVLLPVETAIWTSFAFSMFSHFAVGAARSFFTGRSVFRSGVDMLIVGFGVAAIGYLVGDLAVKYWLG